MKKKTSAVAIVIAVLFSILLFPFIFASGLGSGVIFSVGSVVAPSREADLYQSFVDSDGMDWVYDLVKEGMEEGLAEGLKGNLNGQSFDLKLDVTTLLPREQVEVMVYDIYHAIIKGNAYQFDFSYQNALIKSKLNEYFDTTVTDEIKRTIEENLDAEIQKEYGEGYQLLTENEKQEVREKVREKATNIAMEEAEAMFETEVLAKLDAEVAKLENDLSVQINGVYDSKEYQDLKKVEEEFGYSLTDRTELCKAINLAGYVMLGFTGILLLILLLCHLFRPSGFFTSGAFCLVIGGIMVVAAKAMKGLLLSFIRSELSREFSAEELPEFIMPMIEDVLGWLPVGLEKVGMIGLGAAVLLILVGILLLVIRRNLATE